MGTYPTCAHCSKKLSLTSSPKCRRTIYDDTFIRQYIEDLLTKIRTSVRSLCMLSLIRAARHCLNQAKTSIATRLVAVAADPDCAHCRQLYVAFGRADTLHSLLKVTQPAACVTSYGQLSGLCPPL